MLRPLLISALVLLASTVLALWSGRIADWDGAWRADALLALGSAGVLGVAFFWLNRILERQLERRVDEVQESVEEQAVVIKEVRADVADQQRSIDDLVRERMTQAGRILPTLARDAAEARRPSGMADAIRQARQLGTLADVPPTVPVVGAPGFWVMVDAADDSLALLLGHLNRPPGETIMLRDDDVAVGLAALGEQVCTDRPELRETVQPPMLFDRVADLLALGASRGARFGLFARVGGWGALPGYVVSLGDRPPMVRIDASEGEEYIAGRGPRGMSANEKRLVREACAFAADPHAMFRDSPESR